MGRSGERGSGISVLVARQHNDDDDDDDDERFECEFVSMLVSWLVGFYGKSTFVGYLTPNPFYMNN